MPERLAYDEAMQFSTIRLKLQDPELKQGKVEMVSIKTAQGEIERPWGIEGGFAVVYKFRRKSGTICALRCFRVPMDPDTQFRYERIGPYFQLHAREITAGFNYYDAAIIVKEQGKPPDQKYPVIEMDWVDGVTLVDKIHELCRKRNRAALKALAEQWLNILRTMQNARIAHGDLAGVNVMVRVDGKMILIDYDGVYIPEFVGRTQLLLGQEDFQHPQMGQRTFQENMDAFSALVIYTALIALSVKPELWDAYAKVGLDRKLLDTNTLFRKQDFEQPSQSPLFRDLEQVNDQQVRAMVQELKRACLQPINNVKFPFTLVDPDYQQKQALAKLEHAVQADDDEQIVACWLPLLEQYPPAQRHWSRVQLAQQRVRALQVFRNALTTGNLQQILQSYDATQLDASKNVSSAERAVLSLARDFLQAYNDDNDDALVTAVALQNTITATRIVFTPQQQQRLALARQRKNALQAMQTAFASKSIAQIAAAYPLVQNLKGLTKEERKRAELAVAFMQAYNATNDDAFLASYDALQDIQNRKFFICTQPQEQRAKLIRRRKEALERFRAALISRSPWRLVTAYDTVLDNSPQVTATEHEQFALARILTAAFQSDNDDRLIAADSALQQSMHRSFFLLTDQEKQRITLAHQQKVALLNFRSALTSRYPRQIVAAYVPMLNTNASLSQEERERLAIARFFVNAFDKDDDDALIVLDGTLQKPVVQGFFIVTPREQERIALAKKRAHALETFRHALLSSPKNAQKIVDAYDPSLLNASNSVTGEQREIVASAQRYLAMYEAAKTGIRLDDDKLIRNAYDPALAQRFFGFSPAEQQRIDKAMLTKALEDLLDKREYEPAIKLAQSIQKTAGQEIDTNLTFKLKRATMRFIREQDLTNMTLHVEERGDTNYATVTWEWPTSELIQIALLVWSSDTWPDRPKVQSLRDPHYIQVRRKNNNVLHDSHSFAIGKGGHVYARGFAAILDIWDQEKTWRFSDGDEPTSSAEAASPQMIWNIQ